MTDTQPQHVSDELNRSIEDGLARETALRNRVTELEAALKFATSCSDFHLATAERAKAHADRLWCAAKAADGRHGQNARLREMWRDERAKRKNAAFELTAHTKALRYRQAALDLARAQRDRALQEASDLRHQTPTQEPARP